jgi:hypothetical protein
MDHRLFAILAIVCFAFWGAGCASHSQVANRETILMPLQTGSVLQRRVVVEKEEPAKKSEKEKEPKKEKAKHTTPKPSPKPEVEPEPKPLPTPVEETAQPERFR